MFSIAKNYLNKAHIDELNRIVSAYLDLAENQAKTADHYPHERLGAVPSQLS